MPVNIAPTELNQRLSDSIRSRIAADGFLITGKAAFWRLVGLGFIAFGVGAAVGIAFYGYSYITRSEENLSSLSSAFARALSEVQLHATAQGSVQLQPTELTLAKGQTVSLDSNSRVLLDPASKVLADGEMRVRAPTISVPQSVAPRSAPTAPIISNFTVFKAVPFGEGDVMTGWIFLTSTQKSPTHQYCYYTVHSDTPGLNVSLDLGDDERPETPKNVPNGFNVADAFSRCVWFRSGVQ
jgi:hypothetical protein